MLVTWIEWCVLIDSQNISILFSFYSGFIANICNENIFCFLWWRSFRSSAINQTITAPGKAEPVQSSVTWLIPKGSSADWDSTLSKHSPVEGSQWERKIVTCNRHLALCENASDRVVTGFDAAFDWLRGWPKFSKPIQRGAKQNLCNHWLLFEPRSKVALGDRFPTYCNPRSSTSQVHTANQL